VKTRGKLRIMMIVKINGEDRDLDENGATVSELLKLQKVEVPDMVSVQVNRAFVDREDFSTTRVAEGDEIDFLYFMGGGSAA